MTALHLGRAALPALLPALFAGAAWALAASRLMHRAGQDEAALAAALVVALAVAVTTSRWAVHESTREALAAGACPRCRRALLPEHVHAAEGALGAGLQLWECTACGYRRSEALTCRGCRS